MAQPRVVPALAVLFGIMVASAPGQVLSQGAGAQGPAPLSNPNAPPATPETISGVPLCGEARDATCVVFDGPSSMTMYPKDREDNDWFHLGFELSGLTLRPIEAEPDNVADRVSFSGLECDQSTRQEIYDYLTQYVCRASSTSENGHEVYVGRVLNLFTKDVDLTWGAELVSITANSIKDSWVFSFDEGFLEQVNRLPLGADESLVRPDQEVGVIYADWTANWNVPSTWQDFMSAGIAVDGATSMDPTQMSRITRNQQGSVTRVDIDALLKLSMAVPQFVGVGDNEDASADLSGLRPQRFRQIKNEAAAGTEVVAVEMAGGEEVPSAAAGAVRFYATRKNEYIVDPIFVMERGALAKGSIPLNVVVYLVVIIVVLLLGCCSLACYRRCTRKGLPPPMTLEQSRRELPLSRQDAL